MSITEIASDRDLTLIASVLVAAALLTTLFLVLTLRALGRRRPMAGLRNSVFTLLGIAGAAVLALVFSNLYVYQRLTQEQTVAELTFARISERHFRAVLRESEGQNREFDLVGDEWQLDARVLKWHAWAQVLGMQPRYRLERIQGRYRDVRQEKTARRSVYDLAVEAEFDLWEWLQNVQPQWRWVDTVYGSSAYLPMLDGASYTVSLSTTGLVARPGNELARQAVHEW